MSFDFDSKDIEFYLVAVHLPRSKVDRNRELNDLFKQLKYLEGIIIVIGDFNMNQLEFEREMSRSSIKNVS